jgi:hypothetical protein
MSLRKAINNKCKECIYCPNSGGGSWRQQVAACTAKSCPLFNVRPKPTQSTKRNVTALEFSTKGQFEAIANG